MLCSPSTLFYAVQSINIIVCCAVHQHHCMLCSPSTSFYAVQSINIIVCCAVHQHHSMLCSPTSLYAVQSINIIVCCAVHQHHYASWRKRTVSGLGQHINIPKKIETLPIQSNKDCIDAGGHHVRHLL